MQPLLARGRDRLETLLCVMQSFIKRSPYSLGDAIDWKLIFRLRDNRVIIFPLLARGRDRLETPRP